MFMLATLLFWSLQGHHEPNLDLDLELLAARTAASAASALAASALGLRWIFPKRRGLRAKAEKPVQVAGGAAGCSFEGIWLLGDPFPP